MEIVIRIVESKKKQTFFVQKLTKYFFKKTRTRKGEQESVVRKPWPASSWLSFPKLYNSSPHKRGCFSPYLIIRVSSWEDSGQLLAAHTPALNYRWLNLPDGATMLTSPFFLKTSHMWQAKNTRTLVILALLSS